MTKLVNIILQGRAITSLKHPITKNMSKVYLNTEDIKTILQGNNGIVREVFPDGSVLDLTLENYDKPDLFETFKKQQEQAKAEAKAVSLEERKLQEVLQEKRNQRQNAIAKALGHAPKLMRIFGAKEDEKERDVPVADTPRVDVDEIRAKIEQNKEIKG